MAKKSHERNGRGHAFARELGRRLRDARKAAGMSVPEAAALTHGQVNDRSWRLYEHGHGQPKLSAYLVICLALGRPLHALLPAPLAEACRRGRYSGADLSLLFDPRLLDRRTRRRISGGIPDGEVGD